LHWNFTEAKKKKKEKKKVGREIKLFSFGNETPFGTICKFPLRFKCKECAFKPITQVVTLLSFD
jgi:hypothetical protein